jgi:hypothetical protein
MLIVAGTVCFCVGVNIVFYPYLVSVQRSAVAMVSFDLIISKLEQSLPLVVTVRVLI